MSLKNRFSGTGILDSIEAINTVPKKTRIINIDKIIPNPANEGYSLDNIDELAQNIIENELIHNLVIKPLPDGMYRIISGHRRRLALYRAYEITGDEKYKNPECIVRDDLADVVDEEIALHRASTDDRELTGSEKAFRAKRLMELYKIKRERGESIEGKIRGLVARDMGMSESQIQRYINMDRLIPELKQLADNGQLPVSTAERFSGLDKADQQAAYEKIAQDINSKQKKVTRQDADKIRRVVEKVKEAETVMASEKAPDETQEIAIKSKLQFLLQTADTIFYQTDKPFGKWDMDLIKKDLKQLASDANILIGCLNRRP